MSVQVQRAGKKDAQHIFLHTFWGFRVFVSFLLLVKHVLIILQLPPWCRCVYRREVSFPATDMLRVWSVSGKELAAVPTGQDVEDVVGLKGHLRSLHGFPACLQQLLHAGRCLEDGAPLAEPVDLQLVLLSTLRRKQMHQGKNELFEYVADTGHVEVARALLAAGVDKNLQGSCQDTALMQACSKGHVGIARLLLDAGAKKNLRDENGETAPKHACWEGHVEIVRLLLGAGAKDLQDECGKTALILASAKGHVKIVRLLLDAGANKNLRDEEGETALMYASAKGHVTKRRSRREPGRLQRSYASKDLRIVGPTNRHGAYALPQGFSNVHEQIVRLLLDAGAHKDLQDQFGKTALMRASAEGHVEIVRLLLDAGANRNLRDEERQTALMRAAANIHVENVPTGTCRPMVRSLSDGHLPMDTDEVGKNALLQASSNLIARLLRANSAKVGS